MTSNVDREKFFIRTNVFLDDDHKKTPYYGLKFMIKWKLFQNVSYFAIDSFQRIEDVKMG